MELGDAVEGEKKNGRGANDQLAGGYNRGMRIGSPYRQRGSDPPPDWGLGPAACVEAGAKRWDLLCPTATAPWTDSRIRFDAALLRDGDERPTRP
jgi:hypothetical protein